MENEKIYIPLKHAWIWILALILLGFMVKPAFREIKSWRANIYLARAKEALTKGDLTRTKEQSLLCLQLKWDHPDAIRVLARLADLKRDPNSIGLWNHLLQTKEATDDDRIALGEVALRENFLSLAEEQLTVLLARLTPSKEIYHLAGLLAIRQQRASLAREWFMKALAMDPSYKRAEVNLARVELFFLKNKEAEQQGLTHLRNRITVHDEWELESLRLLVQWGTENPQHLPYDSNLAEQLKKHPQSQIQDLCSMADWEIRTDPKRKGALVASITESAKNLPAEDKREVGAWLNSYKLFQKTLEIFPLDPKAPQSLIFVQLDALAALRKWEQIRDFLAEDVLTEQPSLRLLFRARADRELGNEKLYDLGWHQAIRAAEKSPPILRYLIHYATEMKETAHCAEVYETLSQISEHQLEALLRLISLYEPLGQTQNLFRTMQRLLLLFPKDTVILNDVTYLGLLLDDPSVKAADRAYEVYSGNPRLPAFAATYALAKLKAGQPTIAVKTIEDIPASELTAPGWQAVYAASLAAHEHKAEAIKIAQKIDFTNLKPEEKKLLEPFFPIKRKD